MGILNGHFNPFDYYFSDALKIEIYKGRSQPFANLYHLKRRIKRVWQRAISIEQIEKAVLQFRSFLKQVRRAEEDAIEEHFG